MEIASQNDYYEKLLETQNSLIEISNTFAESKYYDILYKVLNFPSKPDTGNYKLYRLLFGAFRFLIYINHDLVVRTKIMQIYRNFKKINTEDFRCIEKFYIMKDSELLGSFMDLLEKYNINAESTVIRIKKSTDALQTIIKTYNNNPELLDVKNADLDCLLAEVELRLKSPYFYPTDQIHDHLHDNSRYRIAKYITVTVLIFIFIVIFLFLIGIIPAPEFTQDVLNVLQ